MRRVLRTPKGRDPQRAHRADLGGERVSPAFRTVLAADFSSFIAAFILYTLTVGDVRGFAFFLGLATLLNVVTTYFFTRPLVILDRSSGLGVARAVSSASTGAWACGHWPREHRDAMTTTAPQSPEP